MALDFFCQCVRGSFLCVANDVPVFLESGSGIAVTQLPLHNCKRSAFLKHLARCRMAESVKPGMLDP